MQFPLAPQIIHCFLAIISWQLTRKLEEARRKQEEELDAATEVGMSRTSTKSSPHHSLSPRHHIVTAQTNTRSGLQRAARRGTRTAATKDAWCSIWGTKIIMHSLVPSHYIVVIHIPQTPQLRTSNSIKMSQVRVEKKNGTLMRHHPHPHIPMETTWDLFHLQQT